MTVPAGATDTHMHIYDRSYPAGPAATLFPPDASVADYLEFRTTLGLERVVLVQPSTYGLDNRCQLHALAALGPESRGVMVVDSRTPRADLDHMRDMGVVGARFHMLPGGAVGWHELEPTAAAIADLGWHIQLQLDGNTLPGLVERLEELPTPLVIDHVGRFMPPPDPADAAVDALLRLVEGGRTWVKLSAPYEAETDPSHEYAAVAAIVDRLVERAPERLLWASNWPHPGRDDPPTSADLTRLIDRWLPSEALRRRVLSDNPAVLYGFAPRERIDP